MSTNPLPEEIRRRAIDFVRSPEYDSYFLRLEPGRNWRLLVAILAMVSVIGIPVGLYQFSVFVREGRQRRGRREEWIARALHSQLILSYPIMANSALRSDPDAVAPALVIGSFDPRATTEVVSEVARRLLDLEPKAPDAGPPDDLVEFLADETFEPGRRRRLPDRITQGIPVFAFDVWIFRTFQGDPNVRGPFVPCLAEPGSSGQILMVPWWVVAD